MTEVKCDGTRWRTGRGTSRMEWVASTLHTTLEHGVSSTTTTDPHTSAASIRLKWRPRRFKWTRPFRRKTKSGFCACGITFLMQSTYTECVLVSLFIQHAMRKRRIVIRGLSRSTNLPHYLVNATIFEKKLLKIKCVFWVSLKLLSSMFFNLRRIE